MSFNLTLEEREGIFKQEQFSSKLTDFFLNVSSIQRKPHSERRIGLLEDGLSESQIIDLAFRKNINYVIQNSIHPLSDKIKLLKRIESSQDLYFHEDLSFFESNYGKHKIIFDRDTPRSSILNLAFHRLQLNINMSRTMALKSGMEEIIMNAQLDAINLSKDKTPRKLYLILEKGENLVAVSVIDPYGSLSNDKFLGRIESCLNIGLSASINQSRQTGAGIGSAIIFNAADSLFLGSIANKKTRVVAIIPYNISEKKQEKLQKSIVLI